MPKEIHLWRVSNGRLDPVPDGRLDLESRLEDWLMADLGLLGQRLLIIGRQVPTEFGGYIDLLALDASGDLVIIELKRDRTPREVTAQLLDYASWAAELSAERIVAIAERQIGSSLDTAFRQTFDADLPEVINAGHKLLVIGSTIDAASERIIRYLSDRHGVNINAVTFQYFRLPGGDEVLGRVHLLEPERVDQNTRDKGDTKRRIALSLDELEREAERQGVGDLYRAAVSTFRPLFKTQPTRSSLRLAANFGDKTGGVLNLIPTEAKGGHLPFQLYTNRASQMFRRSAAEIAAGLPAGSETWQYAAGADPWWQGHAGAFQNADDVARLRAAFGEPSPESRAPST